MKKTTQQKKTAKSPEKKDTNIKEIQNEKETKEKSTQKPKEDQKKTEQKNQEIKDNKDNKANNNNKENQKSPEKNQKKLRYKIDFIYRRQKYTLKNLIEDYLLSKIKTKISQELKVDLKCLKFYYKENELKSDQDKKIFYQIIKQNNDTFPIIEVKKESLNEQNITSLNTNLNLIYKVNCKNIEDYQDFINKIEQFFKDICIENHYICEPKNTKEYDVCFLCSDHCFQFKRYMMNYSRMDKLYSKATFKVLDVDKNLLGQNDSNYNNDYIEDDTYGKIEKIVVKDKKTNNDIEIQFRKIKHKENDYFPKEFINKGPYEDPNKVKKIDEKNNNSNDKKKKKKKDFNVY